MIYQKLAVFKCISISTTNILEDWAEDVDDYIRITEYMDCRFEELPIDTQISAELEILDKMENEIKEKASEGMTNIQRRKKELLALTHQPQEKDEHEFI